MGFLRNARGFFCPASSRSSSTTTDATVDTKAETNDDIDSDSEPLHLYELNASLGSIPELRLACDSLYAYPLSGTHWLEPTAKVNRQPCFVVVRDAKTGQAKKDTDELPKGYVYGWGRYGYGYYHLMTQEAWKALYKKRRSSLKTSSKTCAL